MRYVLFLMVFICGCAFTNITSFRDPAFPDKSFSCMVVCSSDPSFAYSQMIENTLVSKLTNAGIKAFSSVAVVPPTRKYDMAEFSKAFIDFGCDGILLVDVTGGRKDVLYIPNQQGGANPLI